MTDVKIIHIEDSVGNIDPLQVCIETGDDSQTGYRMMGYRDGAGDTYKLLAKSKPAYIQSLNISAFTTAGLVRTDATGNLYGDVNTLGELNTHLGGTTIDESTDPRDPTQHAIGSATYHSASTLAQVNALISDATLDDSGDSRTPTQHAIGSGTYHSASTLAELNLLISDGTIDKTTDSRTPTTHATSHEGGSDTIDAAKMTGTADDGDTGLSISNAKFGTDTSVLGVVRDETLLWSGDDLETSVGGNYLDVDDDSLYVISGTDNIYRIDKRTGAQLDTNATAQNRAFSVIGNTIACPGAGATAVREYYKYDLSVQYSASVSGGTLGLIFDTAYREADGKIWALDGTTPGNIFTLTRSGVFGDLTGSYTYASVGSIDTNAGMFCFSADENYIFAFISNASNSRIIKYSTSLVQQEQSPVFNEGTSTVAEVSLRVCGDVLIASCEAGTLYFDVTDLTSGPINTGSSTPSTGARILDECGCLYILSEDDTNLHFEAVQTPALTLNQPAYVDGRGGNAIFSADGFVDDSGNTIYWTKTDVGRAVINSGKPYRAKMRKASAATEIELYDEGNIVHFTDARTGSLVITIDAAVLAIDGFRFTIMTDYDSGNEIDLVIVASSQWWRMNGNATDGYPRFFDFIIEDGIPVPCGGEPTYLSA